MEINPDLTISRYLNKISEMLIYIFLKEDYFLKKNGERIRSPFFRNTLYIGLTKRFTSIEVSISSNQGYIVSCTKTCTSITQ